MNIGILTENTPKKRLKNVTSWKTKPLQIPEINKSTFNWFGIILILKSIIEITSKILTITIIVITLIYSPWLLLIAEFLLSLLFYRPCNPKYYNYENPCNGVINMCLIYKPFQLTDLTWLKNNFLNNFHYFLLNF